MRRVLTLAATALLPVVAGCTSSSHVTTTPASSAAVSATGASQQASVPATPSPSPTPTTSAPPAVATVGQTINLTGNEAGESVAVTVVKIVDPAPAKQYSSPEAGTRFVAVQFRLQNTGTATYRDSPGNGAKVIDTQGQQFAATVSDTAAGPGFPGETAVAPGATALGFVTFDVPSASRPAQIQFALDSGFAKAIGQWNVP